MSDVVVHNVENENVAALSINEENEKTEIEVRFEVGGKIIDLSQVNRVARRLLEGQAKKYQTKYANLVGPNNVRPAIIIRSPRLLDKKVEIVLEYPDDMKDLVKGHSKATRIS
jgi:hypothetical protein